MDGSVIDDGFIPMSGIFLTRSNAIELRETLDKILAIGTENVNG